MHVSLHYSVERGLLPNAYMNASFRMEVGGRKHIPTQTERTMHQDTLTYFHELFALLPFLFIFFLSLSFSVLLPSTSSYHQLNGTFDVLLLYIPVGFFLSATWLFFPFSPPLLGPRELPLSRLPLHLALPLS